MCDPVTQGLWEEEHETYVIELAPGKFTYVDMEDYDLIKRFRYRIFLEPKAKTAYAVRSIYVGGGHSTSRYMHSDVFGGLKDIDHIDGDGLNNRRRNLRVATRSEQNMNRTSSNKHGYKGVRQNGNRWGARVSANGRTRHGPQRDTVEEAARDHDEMAREMHGKFAMLNFPSEWE